MRLMPQALLVPVLLLSACASTPVPKVDRAAAEKEIIQRVDSLLYRYTQNDQAGVIAMLDPERFTINGSSLAESVHDVEQLRGFMSRDAEQWGGNGSFKDIRDMDVRVGADLASAYFLFTFSAPNAPTLPIRLCTTWRKVNGEWLLTQSSNAVMAPQP